MGDGGRGEVTRVGIGVGMAVGEGSGAGVGGGAVGLASLSLVAEAIAGTPTVGVGGWGAEPHPARPPQSPEASVAMPPRSVIRKRLRLVIFLIGIAFRLGMGDYLIL